MKKRDVTKLGKKITRKVIKYWGKHDHTKRHHFSAGLDIIIQQIVKHCNIPVGEVGKYTSAVIDDFAIEYQKLPHDMKGQEPMVSMIYALYMKHLEKI